MLPDLLLGDISFHLGGKFVQVCVHLLILEELLTFKVIQLGLGQDHLRVSVIYELLPAGSVLESLGIVGSAIISVVHLEAVVFLEPVLPSWALRLQDLGC